MRFETSRLYVIPGARAFLQAELDGNLADIIGYNVPDNWPPALYDEDAIRWTLNAIGEQPEWYLHYIALKETNTLIGVAGYKGPPNEEGIVEIGYGILEQFQRNGYATEASRSLIERAFTDARVTAVIAETYPTLTPSLGVMEKCGMTYAGIGSEEFVVRYEIKRP